MSFIATTATVESILETVHQIGPILRQHSREAERARRLPDEVANAMRERGLYRLWRPRVFGGLEVDPMSGIRIFEELSRLDSAAGWNVQLSCAWDPLGAWFSDDGAREVFGDPHAILGGAFFPPRRAVPVGGGYRITGQTPFVSGAHQCDWFLGLAHIFDNNEPRLGENGGPVALLTACPSSEAQIVDTWHTLGMCGTGSHDVVMKDVFVPDRRTAPLVPLQRPGLAYYGPLYRFTIWASVAALAPVATGIARAAIDELLDLANTKTPSYTVKTLRDRSVVQSQVAQAEAQLGAARAYLHEALQQVWDGAVTGHTITQQQKVTVQLATTHAVVASAEAVDLVHAASGTSGIRNECGFPRHFRDVHTITQHGFISASRYESAGQLLLGLNTDWPFFAL
jgi:alkylation response protein AidB-like acyl-CoA dehydrogenase